jgi:hypothetical protein
MAIKKVTRSMGHVGAKLKTNGTIFDKQTQLLSDTDDKDIMRKIQKAGRRAFLALAREANKVRAENERKQEEVEIAAETDTANLRTKRGVWRRNI